MTTVVYRSNDRGKDRVQHNLVLVSGQTGFKSLFPCQTHFGVDVNDVDAGAERDTVFPPLPALPQ